MSKTLYEEFKDRLPDNMTASMINSMSREIVENLVDEFGIQQREKSGVEETPPVVDVKEDDKVDDETTSVENDDETSGIIDTDNSLMTFFTNQANERASLVDDGEDEVKGETTKEETVVESETTKKVKEPVKVKVKKNSLSDLNILNINSVEAHNSFNRYVGRRVHSTYMVVLPVSGYSANVRGLKIDEVDSIRSSFGDGFETMERLRELAYACIETNSAGFTTYSEFCELTSKSELEILLFGIMVKTFGHINEFNVNCSGCKGTSSIKLDMNSIVRVDNAESINQINAIKTASDGKEFCLAAPMSITDRVLLPDSKIVLDIRIPSLKKESDITKFFRTRQKDSSTRLFYLLTITDAFFLPHFNEKMDSDDEPVGYVPLTSSADMMIHLNNLSADDRRVINETLDSLYPYNVDFRLEGIKCSHCKRSNEVAFDILPNFFKLVLDEAT